MELGDVLKQWDDIRQTISKLQDQEQVIKESIHDLMNQKGTDSFSTRHYVCTRRIQARQNMCKKNVPSVVWQQFAQTTEFPVLSLRRKK